MKTKVEVEGYEIEINLEGGMISVTAQKGNEVIEEFSISIEEAQDTEEAQDSEEGQDGEEIQNFGDYDEEEDFSGEEDDDDDDEEDDDDDNDDEAQMGMKAGMQNQKEAPALESFQSFVSRKKK